MQILELYKHLLKIYNDSLNLRTVISKATVTGTTVFDSLSKIGQKAYKISCLSVRQSSWGGEIMLALFPHANSLTEK